MSGAGSPRARELQHSTAANPPEFREAPTKLDGLRIRGTDEALRKQVAKQPVQIDSWVFTLFKRLLHFENGFQVLRKQSSVFLGFYL